VARRDVSATVPPTIGSTISEGTLHTALEGSRDGLVLGPDAQRQAGERAAGSLTEKVVTALCLAFMLRAVWFSGPMVARAAGSRASPAGLPSLDTEPCPKRGISVFEDRKEEGVWRVEYFDEDGGCYVTIFAGPGAERRARDYGEALKALRPGGMSADLCPRHGPLGSPSPRQKQLSPGSQLRR
jgi:hypothetical protein